MVEPVSILGYSLVAFFAVQCPLAFLAFWRRRKTFPIAGRAPNLVVLFCGVTLPLLLSTPIALTQDDFPTRSHLRCVLYLGLQAAALIYSLFVVLARVVLLLFHFRTTDDLRRLEAQRAHPVTGPSAAAAALAGSFFTRRHYIASPAFFRKALLVITVLQVAILGMALPFLGSCGLCDTNCAFVAVVNVGISLMIIPQVSLLLLCCWKLLQHSNDAFGIKREIFSIGLVCVAGLVAPWVDAFVNPDRAPHEIPQFKLISAIAVGWLIYDIMTLFPVWLSYRHQRQLELKLRRIESMTKVEELLALPLGTEAFLRFCTREFCAEDVLFHQRVQRFRDGRSGTGRRSPSVSIATNLSPHSPLHPTTQILASTTGGGGGSGSISGGGGGGGGGERREVQPDGLRTVQEVSLTDCLAEAALLWRVYLSPRSARPASVNRATADTAWANLCVLRALALRRQPHAGGTAATSAAGLGPVATAALLSQYASGGSGGLAGVSNPSGSFADDLSTHLAGFGGGSHSQVEATWNREGAAVIRALVPPRRDSFVEHDNEAENAALGSAIALVASVAAACEAAAALTPPGERKRGASAAGAGEVAAAPAAASATSVPSAVSVDVTLEQPFGGSTLTAASGPSASIAAAKPTVPIETALSWPDEMLCDAVRHVFDDAQHAALQAMQSGPFQRFRSGEAFQHFLSAMQAREQMAAARQQQRLQQRAVDGQGSPPLHASFLSVPGRRGTGRGRSGSRRGRSRDLNSASSYEIGERAGDRTAEGGQESVSYEATHGPRAVAGLPGQVEEAASGDAGDALNSEPSASRGQSGAADSPVIVAHASTSSGTSSGSGSSRGAFSQDAPQVAVELSAVSAPQLPSPRRGAGQPLSPFTKRSLSPPLLSPKPFAADVASLGLAQPVALAPSQAAAAAAVDPASTSSLGSGGGPLSPVRILSGGLATGSGAGLRPVALRADTTNPARGVLKPRSHVAADVAENVSRVHSLVDAQRAPPARALPPLTVAARALGPFAGSAAGAGGSPTAASAASLPLPTLTRSRSGSTESRAARAAGELFVATAASSASAPGSPTGAGLAAPAGGSPRPGGGTSARSSRSSPLSLAGSPPAQSPALSPTKPRTSATSGHSRSGSGSTAAAAGSAGAAGAGAGASAGAIFTGRSSFSLSAVLDLEVERAALASIDAQQQQQVPVPLDG